MTRTRRLTPPVVLAVGMAAFAVVVAATTSARMPVLVSFDESVYKLAAAHDATGGLEAIRHDAISRGIARLYSLLLAPVFAVFAGDTGIDVGRALGTVAFALTAVPVYALGRQVLRSRWAAVAVALLAILVPWATISTVLFSEALAYPLFATTLLAMTWALRAPAPRRDLAVVALLGALVLVRPQFAGVAAGWVLVVGWTELRGPGSWRTAVRRYPLLSGLVALAVLVVLVLVAAGKGGTLAHRLGGPYVSSESGLRANVVQMGLFEVAMLALGTGVVPFVLGLAWVRPALSGRLGGGPRRVALAGGVSIVAVFVVALLALGQFPGPAVAEERYFIYAAPLILLAAFGALEQRLSSRGTLTAGAALVLAVLALAPMTAGLSSERAFLVPVSATATNIVQRLEPDHAADLNAIASDRRLLLVLTGAAVLGLALVAARRARWAALVPAAVLQLAILGYGFATMHGHVPGIPGVTGSAGHDLAWVDRATPGGPDVALLADGSAPDMAPDLGVAFWNDETNRTLRLPSVSAAAPPYPVDALPAQSTEVGADLRLTPAPSTRLVTATIGSPYVQLAGRRLAREPGGGEVLLRLDQPARATWEARGLGVQGAITGPVQIAAAPAHLTLTFVAGPAPSRATVSFGSMRRRVDIPAAGETTVRLDACPNGNAGLVVPAGGQPFLRAVVSRPC